MVAGAFVLGLLAAAALWVLSAATFGGAVFQRENFRGRSLPTAVGIIVALVVLATDAVVSVASWDCSTISAAPARAVASQRTCARWPGVG